MQGDPKSETLAVHLSGARWLQDRRALQPRRRVAWLHAAAASRSVCDGPTPERDDRGTPQVDPFSRCLSSPRSRPQLGSAAFSRHGRVILCSAGSRLARGHGRCGGDSHWLAAGSIPGSRIVTHDGASGNSGFGQALRGEQECVRQGIPRSACAEQRPQADSGRARDGVESLRQRGGRCSLRRALAQD